MKKFENFPTAFERPFSTSVIGREGEVSPRAVENGRVRGRMCSGRDGAGQSLSTRSEP